jgi:hypothetical protein
MTCQDYFWRGMALGFTCGFFSFLAIFLAIRFFEMMEEIQRLRREKMTGVKEK